MIAMALRLSKKASTPTVHSEVVVSAGSRTLVVEDDLARTQLTSGRVCSAGSLVVVVPVVARRSEEAAAGRGQSRVTTSKRRSRFLSLRRAMVSNVLSLSLPLWTASPARVQA